MARTIPFRLLFVPMMALVLTIAAFSQDTRWETDPFAANPSDLLLAARMIEATEDADAVVLLNEATYTFDKDGTATVRTRRIYQLRTQRGTEFLNTVSASWEPWRQDRPVFRGRVITAEGSVHELDPKTIAEAPQPMALQDVYSDSKILRGPLPGVAPGAVVVSEVVTKDRQPAFGAGVNHRFVFVSVGPVRKARLQVDAPKSVPLRYVIRNIDGAEPRREESGGRVRLTFEAGPLPSPEGRPLGLPADRAWWPQVVFSTGRTWNEVARHYREIVDRQIAEASADALRVNVPENASRGEAIAELVRSLHSRVRFTGVEFGEASYVPRPPPETLARGYGDCKDKATLLIAMLRSRGIDATIALLRTGPDEEVEAEMPGFGLFNHAIVHISDDAKPLWIDATDPYSRVGELPLADQGRLALIADPSSTELVRIPWSTSTDNRELVEMEFHLAPFGGARVVETTQSWGSIEREHREALDGVGAKDLTKQFSDYVEYAFSSTEIVHATVTNARDLFTPHQIRLEADEAMRGTTGVAEAVVAIQPSGLLARLPWALRYQFEEKDEKEERAEEFEMFNPHTVEWRYRIVPPLGYKPRELPAGENVELGTAHLSSEYKQGDGDAVLATLRFDSGKRRLTAREFEETRKAVQKFAETGDTLIGFDQTGEAHLAAGRIREAIEEFRGLRDAEPESAIHYTRIARALLAAGLGEPARLAIGQAKDLDPDSAVVQRTLGWILEHDLIGRRFERGSDYAAAEAAYRKAIELDAEDAEARASLAILLEHNPQGVRYGKGARLDEAIEQYQSLLKKEDQPEIERNLAVALAQAGRYQDLRDHVESVENPELEGYRVAALAMLDGADAAIGYVSRTAPDNKRSMHLIVAGQLLMLTREYDTAGTLSLAAARGAPNAAQILGMAETLKKIRRHETVELSPADPLWAVDQLFIRLLGSYSLDEMFEVMSRHAQRHRADAEQKAEFERAARQGRIGLVGTGLSTDNALDFGLSARQAGVEGDDEDGYRVSVQYGPQKATYFVIKEDGDYHVLDAIFDIEGPLADLAREVLARTDAGRLKSAAKLLNWVREARVEKKGDDPLGGRPFSRLWSDGAGPTREKLRYAAAALLAEEKFDAGDAIKILESGRKMAKNNYESLQFDSAIAFALASAERYGPLAIVARRMLNSFPMSDAAFLSLTSALRHKGEWGEFDRAVEARLKLSPKDVAALRAKLTGAVARADLDNVIALTEQLKQKGLLEPMDLNNRAWVAISAGRVDASAVDAIQQAMMLAQNDPKPELLNTLAAIFAETDRLAEAHEILLQYLSKQGLSEPDDATWYVLGRIAEAYGENDAARAAYQRVEAPENKHELPDSSYAIARRRLALLDGAD